MIRSIGFENFTVMPHLEHTTLMQKHGQTVYFSNTKPNVIIGPNGSGKSTLLSVLAKQTLSEAVGVSAFDTMFLDAELWDGNTRSEYGPFTYLPGMTVDSDNAAAVYYRPAQLPGKSRFLAEALMRGYGDYARAYREKTHQKSSGQQGRALLETAYSVMESGELSYEFNWGYTGEKRPLESVRRISCTPQHEYKAQILLNERLCDNSGMPTILMDEPEQSLDTKEELALWKRLSEVDCSKVQVIVATHSLYPFMHPERFNLIEASAGYLDEVRAMI